MKTILKTTLFATLTFALLSPMAWAQKTVTGVTASQRPGTKKVEIHYNLNFDGAQHVKVRLEASANGGSTWDIPVNTVTGDVGLDVVSGTGKTIVWDAGADWNGQHATNMRYRVFADDLEEMVFISAGSFERGAEPGVTGTSVDVSAFSIAKTEVTKAQWDEVATWAQSHGYDITVAGGAGKAADHPVQSVTWYECVKWCNAKSEKEGRTPVYTVSGSTYKTGESAPDINYTAHGYRLPTEAEWEKAARGELSGKRFPWGDTIDHSFANYYANGSAYSYDVSPYTEYTYHPTYNDGTEPYTSPVGSFEANGYGLYDMSGNVWEWCNDWYGSYTADTTDPTGASSGSNRMFRGGSWDYLADSCRVADRGSRDPGSSRSIMGFRPVLLP